MKEQLAIHASHIFTRHPNTFSNGKAGGKIDQVKGSTELGQPPVNEPLEQMPFAKSVNALWLELPDQFVVPAIHV